MDSLLQIVNLSKKFGILPALKQVNFEVYPGEVVGLTGQSGSGKSVLAMLITGIEAADSGEIHYANRRLQWPFWARGLGIEIIPQEPILAENMDITSNIFLGSEMGWPTPGKLTTWLKPSKMDQGAMSILAQLDMPITSLREKVVNLSSEQRQLIAIARVMTQPAKLILIDDPIALLHYAYQQKLLSLIQNWQQQGTAIIFSSHNLDHLFAVTDRIIVLRQGQLVANYRTDETTREEIVAALLGTIDRQQLTPAIWALDSYFRARQQAEEMHHQQRLLEGSRERDIVCGAGALDRYPTIAARRLRHFWKVMAAVGHTPICCTAADFRYSGLLVARVRYVGSTANDLLQPYRGSPVRFEAVLNIIGSPS